MGKIKFEHNYILVKKTPVKEPDLMKWAFWIEKAQRNNLRRVAYTEIFHEKNPDEVHIVSTVFLGIDYNFSSGPPLLFETMEFIKKGDKEETGDLDRASTWEEAESRHKELVFSVASRLEKEHGPGIHISSTNGDKTKWGKNILTKSK